MDSSGIFLGKKARIRIRASRKGWVGSARRKDTLRCMYGPCRRRASRQAVVTRARFLKTNPIEKKYPFEKKYTDPMRLLTPAFDNGVPSRWWVCLFCSEVLVAPTTTMEGLVCFASGVRHHRLRASSQAKSREVVHALENKTAREITGDDTQRNTLHQPTRSRRSPGIVPSRARPGCVVLCVCMGGCVGRHGS